MVQPYIHSNGAPQDIVRSHLRQTQSTKQVMQPVHRCVLQSTVV